MPETKHTILESWPKLKEDMGNFLSDTDAWVISELRSARRTKDWGKIRKIIDIMELLHNMSHSH